MAETTGLLNRRPSQGGPKVRILLPPLNNGELAEWSKAAVLKNSSTLVETLDVKLS